MTNASVDVHAGEAAAPVRAMLAIDPAAGTRKVSSTLFGLFLEDINFAGDGGMNANLVNNYSFEGVYLERGDAPFVPPEMAAYLGPEVAAQVAAGMVVMTPRGRLFDRTRHWTAEGGTLEAADERPLVPGSHYGRVRTALTASVENPGYPGSGRDMALRGPLTFGAWLRADGFDGAIEARLIDAQGATVGAAPITVTGEGWQRVQASLVPTEAGRGALQIVLIGSGVLDIDEVMLIPDDHWGAGDPRWSQGTFRRDLVEALRDLAPRFLRFPGGCVVEGCGDDSQYRWKDTVGPLEQRKPEYNLWGQFVADGDYSQSHQIGFYEYFLLAEDLDMEPMPVVWAGIACQGRSSHCVPVHSAEFDAIVQDAVDMIDWATGDPASSAWAALRAAAGHPAPFPLNMIAIGNENGGGQYLERFQPIKDAVERRRPGMTVVMSTSGPDGPGFDGVWDHARAGGAQYVVDEHYYRPPAWFLDGTKRYDSYPRDTARVFLGEWAAYPPTMLGPNGERQIFDFSGDGSGVGGETNTWASAVAEAAFLTGLERNSDVVAMSSYAPVFNLVGHGQWAHNLIDFNPETVSRTVNYLVQQLFATNLGDTIVPVTTPLPDKLFASATTDAGTTWVKLVNASESVVELVLSVRGVDSGPFEGTVLHGALDAANRLTFDGVPDVGLDVRQIRQSFEDGVVRLTLQPATVLALRIPRA